MVSVYPKNGQLQNFAVRQMNSVVKVYQICVYFALKMRENFFQFVFRYFRLNSQHCCFNSEKQSSYWFQPKALKQRIQIRLFRNENEVAIQSKNVQYIHDL